MTNASGLMQATNASAAQLHTRDVAATIPSSRSSFGLTGMEPTRVVRMASTPSVKTETWYVAAASLKRSSTWRGGGRGREGQEICSVRTMPDAAPLPPAHLREILEERAVEARGDGLQRRRVGENLPG